MAVSNLTSNKDIDYIQKDFTSSVDAMITYATVNYGQNTSANRLWTNFNVDGFSRNWLEIVAFVSDVLFFYLDNQATQTYLQTATVRSAVLDIAKQFGFSPATSTSASGVGIFTFTSAGTLPRGTQLTSTTGITFFNTNDIIAPIAGDFNGTVLQGTIRNFTFTAEGLQSEELFLAQEEIIKDLDNINSSDISPQVTVNGNSYTLVNSFLRHNGSDTPAITDSLNNIIGGGGRVFTLNEKPDGTKFITFGDGVFGRKLQPGDSISIQYRTGDGSAGNISAETLVDIVDAPSFVSSVTNNTDFSGGADEQSIERLRDLIPASLSTLERAVSQQDYSDIIIANFNEVFDASTEDNKDTVAVDLNIYVIPQGSGITNITDNPSLLSEITNFIDRRKMVTVQFQIKDAFGIDILFSIDVTINDSASRSIIESEIQTVLTDYFNLETGGVNGTGVSFAETVRENDISELIANISGIERFNITRHTYRPRIQENIVSLASDYQNSGVKVFKNVSESEWLLVAAGTQTDAAGATLFSNTVPRVGFTYTGASGELVYNTPVDLSLVSSGDTFIDSSGASFTILGVDTVNSKLFLNTSLTVDDSVPGADADGSITQAAQTYESFKCFKKILGKVSNLSDNSITDNDLDLSVLNSTGDVLSARVLIDNSEVFIPGEYANTEFYLVDANGNIWEILQNDSNTITTSITSVNDASVTSVAVGDYKIVKKVAGDNVTFNGNILGIQYNTDKTVFSIGAQFDQIGTINDDFAISEEQVNIGKLGVALDLVSFDAGTGELILNNNPDLSGVNNNWLLVDSSGQIFNIVGSNNSALPVVELSKFAQDSSIEITGSGLNQKVAQGIQVPTTTDYPVVSFYLKKEGNVEGNLTLSIVNDDGGGKPNLASVVATSTPINVNDLPTDDLPFSEVTFGFSTPPNLTASTQYHIVLNPDAGYVSSQISGVKTFDNSGAETFSYDGGSGELTYDGIVDLSGVLPGHYFEDYNGDLFEILSVDDSANSLTLNTGLTLEDTTPNTGDGSVYQNDRVLVGIDTADGYVDGDSATYDGATWTTGTGIDASFKIQGSKTITVDTTLTPELGSGATVSERYYDDDNEISLTLGISQGFIISATDANDLAKGTVSGTANSPIDSFVFRTSDYAGDISNIRLNEIPEISTDDIVIKIFGGVE